MYMHDKELAMVLTLTFAEKTRRFNCAIDLTIQANQCKATTSVRLRKLVAACFHFNISYFSSKACRVLMSVY